MQEVQLYISGEKVDLFKDETISINDSIQNVRDISKIFTAFTQQFNLPATRTNNKIFSHYYNFDLTGGFDARFKVDALIQLNGTDYKKGKLRLNDVDLKNNVAFSYKVVFFGETVTLSALLGDDDLKTLGSELTAFDQDFSPANTFNGLTRGWTLTGSELILNSTGGTATGDFIYPFISAGRRYFYDTANVVPTEPERSNNLWVLATMEYLPGNLKALHFIDLKPAIKIHHLILAIETKYGITFSTDFFNTSNDDYHELFLWLHREKGDLIQQAGGITSSILLADWDLTVPDIELRTDSNTVLRTINTFSDVTSFDYKVTVNVTGAGLYDIVILDNNNNDILFSDLGLTGNQTKTYVFESFLTVKKHHPVLQINTSGGITLFNTSLELKKTTVNPVTGTTSVTSDYTFNSGGDTTLTAALILNDLLPNMKVIDFLTSIFKLFNLTAYFEDDIIVVKTLDDYYSTGVDRNITKFIDVKKSTISRSKLYSRIDFEYKEPKTLFAIQSNERNNFEFGNLKFEDADDTFDGGAYSINVGFEHTIFQRLLNDDTGSITNYMWGYFVDKDENPTIGAPLLFYAQKQTAVQEAFFDNGVSYDSFFKYMKPANTRGSGLQTINFGTETDEFNLTTNTESLFANFYETYISNLFSIKARILKVEAILPTSFILTYRLNDTIIIIGKKYQINSIKINLQTGKSTLELIVKVNT